MRTSLIQTIHRLLLQSLSQHAASMVILSQKRAAITAAENCMSRDEIKLLVWWQSDAVDIYINELSKPDTIMVMWLCVCLL